MSRSRRSWWWLVALLVVAGAAVAAFLVLRDDGSDTTGSNPSTAPTTSVQARQVASFSGTGGQTTATFTGALNWELRWTAGASSGFTVELLKPDGTSRGRLVAAGTRTRGSTFVGEAGTFKLKVTSKKPWTIQVYSRPVKK